MRCTSSSSCFGSFFNFFFFFFDCLGKYFYPGCIVTYACRSARRLRYVSCLAVKRLTARHRQVAVSTLSLLSHKLRSQALSYTRLSIGQTQEALVSGQRSPPPAI